MSALVMRIGDIVTLQHDELGEVMIALGNIVAIYDSGEKKYHGTFAKIVPCTVVVMKGGNAITISREHGVFVRSHLKDYASRDALELANAAQVSTLDAAKRMDRAMEQQGRTLITDDEKKP